MDPTLPVDEMNLLTMLRDGNHFAFNQIYQRSSPALIANLIKVLKNDVLVEEVLQETFMALWENRAGIDPQQSVDGYLFRISANKAKNLFRRAAHDERMRAYFQPAIEAGYEQIETQLFRKENERLLHKILGMLPVRQREVFTMCKLDGLTYREVAERLGISESAVNGHIMRANSFLRQQFGNHPEIITLLFVLGGAGL